MLLSAALAVPTRLVPSRPVRYLVAIAVAFIVAYCLYWLPAWLEGDRSAFSTWAYLVVPVWFVAGLVGSVVAVLVLEKRGAHAHTEHS